MLCRICSVDFAAFLGCLAGRQTTPPRSSFSKESGGGGGGGGGGGDGSNNIRTAINKDSETLSWKFCNVIVFTGRLRFC